MFAVIAGVRYCQPELSSCAKTEVMAESKTTSRPTFTDDSQQKRNQEILCNFCIRMIFFSLFVKEHDVKPRYFAMLNISRNRPVCAGVALWQQHNLSTGIKASWLLSCANQTEVTLHCIFSTCPLTSLRHIAAIKLQQAGKKPYYYIELNLLISSNLIFHQISSKYSRWYVDQYMPQYHVLKTNVGSRDSALFIFQRIRRCWWQDFLKQ